MAVYRQMGCNDCGAEWTAIYEPVDNAYPERDEDGLPGNFCPSCGIEGEATE